MSVHERGALHRTDESHTVTNLELFFDLVFVFALTQVTSLLAADPTSRGALRGLLVLAIVWWSWTGFTWLGNVVKADEGWARLVLVVVMGAMLVLALAIPEAFQDAGDATLSGPLVFAGCYLAVRALHLGLYFVVGRGNPELLATLARFAVPFLVATVILVGASFTSGAARTALWALALAVDYGLVWAIGSAGWQVVSPGHFAERHGLVVIIALGESIVATGVGAGGLPLTWPVVVGAALALVVLVCLWWLYFDIVAVVAERRLASATGSERVDLARDSYSYLHFPMVAGIVFIALGLKKALGYLGKDAKDGLGGLVTGGEALHGMPLWSLYGGVAAYLLAHVAFRLRNIGSVNRQRLAVAAGLLVAVPFLGHVPAVVQLGLLAAVLLAVVGYETVRFRDWRHAVRHEEHAH